MLSRIYCKTTAELSKENGEKQDEIVTYTSKGLLSTNINTTLNFEIRPTGTRIRRTVPRSLVSKDTLNTNHDRRASMKKDEEFQVFRLAGDEVETE